ncbi:hypothetical protein DSCA_49100 [Desulfosarcina alkanivorans]|uniref:Uncharacterized protein n=1 Tax=Desulfosarcina alkanivorans TaxID=571177 RepID=A0A5K7YRH9_9BACT|nr:hypothetical protein [Desulfosarcina alkanivorans]BBO70980.1 hypothetical protein DSCA_49100 [Desulfosarcina alkanivorans]
MNPRPDDSEMAGMVALLMVIFSQGRQGRNSVEWAVREAQGCLGEYLSLMAGERPRQQDQPHQYSMA